MPSLLTIKSLLIIAPWLTNLLLAVVVKFLYKKNKNLNERLVLKEKTLKTIKTRLKYIIANKDKNEEQINAVLKEDFRNEI